MKKRILSIVLLMAMLFTMLPSMSFATDGEQMTQKTTATVSFTVQADNAFLCAPQKNVSVDSDLAERYGYPDNVTGSAVSALDVLVKAHEIIFEDGFTTEDRESYLQVSSSGAISMLFGEETMANGFFINKAYPHDGTPSQWGGYNGYMINTAPIENGDFVEFFIYQDKNYWSDTYAYIDIEGSMLRGTSVDVTVSGVMCMMGYKYFDQAQMKAAAEGIESAQLAYINKETGTLENISGCITDEDGVATFSLPNTTGTYYLTAYMPEEEINENYAPPIVMPLCSFIVEDANIFTVPADATLFVGEKQQKLGANGRMQDVHFVPFTEISPKKIIDNTDNTKSYYFNLTEGNTYNYRVSGDEYITFAGKNTGKNLKTKVITTEMLQPSGKTKDTIDRDVTSNNGYNVADIYLNINEKGHLNLAAGAEYQLIPLRNWETIDSLTNNYFIEPDYNYSVIDENGNTVDNVVSIDENGVMEAIGNGTAIVLITYDAMNNESAIGGPFFGATWPENTGVFVVTVGEDESNIKTGMTINEGKNKKSDKLSEDAIDAEHDIIYFLGDEGQYTFTPETEDVKVYVANPVVTDTLTFDGYVLLDKNKDGSFTVPLKQGRNIVKLEKNNQKTYQIITAKKFSYTINNGEPVRPGDTISIVMDTIYHPANKLAGVYNMAAVITYLNEDNVLVGGLSNQYQFASNNNSRTIKYKLKKNVTQWSVSYGKLSPTNSQITIPLDYDKDIYTLKNGEIVSVGFGDHYGNHRGITLSDGKAPNLDASIRHAVLGSIPDIVIPIVATTSELNDLKLSTEGVKTEYYEGQVFDCGNLIVTACYEDGTRQTATNYSVSPETLSLETDKVVITYRGKTAEIPVTVIENEITSITVVTPPAKQVYTAGQVFNPSGIKIIAVYTNGGIKDVTSAVAYSNTEFKTEGNANVNIKYTEKGITKETVQEVSVLASTENIGTKNITVKFRLLGDSHHGTPTGEQDTHTLKNNNLQNWLNTNVTVPENSKVIDVIEKALGLAGIPFTNQSGNYISSIKGLGEFDNGSNSGWMYTLNGNHPSKGVAEQVVKNGDSIVFHYTDDYTKEQGSEKWSTDTPGSSAEQTNQSQNAKVEIEVKTDSAGKAVASIDAKTVENVIEEVLQAAEKKVEAGNNPEGITAEKQVTLEVKADSSAKEVSTSIPKEAIKSLDSKVDSVAISTPLGEIKLDSETLTGLAKESSDVNVVVAKKEDAEGRPVFNINITAGDKSIKPSGKVSLNFEYKKEETEDANKLVLCRIDESGNKVPVVKSKFEDGVMTGKTETLGDFVLDYRDVNFKDTEKHWGKENIEFLAARAVINGKGNDNFAPEDNITRAEFVQILYGMSEEKTAETVASVEFIDIDENDWFAKAVAWAASVGITSGTGNNSFSPYANISRQDMSVMIKKYVELVEKEKLGNKNEKISFSDEGSVAGYAKEAVSDMQKAGIINGSKNADGSYSFNPTAKASRAEAATMIANYINN